MPSITFVNRANGAIATDYGISVTSTVGPGTLDINVERNFNSLFDPEVQILTESLETLLTESSNQIIGE